MKSSEKAFIRTSIWITAVIAVHIYLSLFYWNYSPLVFDKGVRVYNYEFRGIVWLVSLVGILLYSGAIAFYWLVLRDKNAPFSHIQRPITLGFVILSVVTDVASIVLAIVYRELDYIWIPTACLAVVILAAMVLCCDCWRDQLYSTSEADLEMIDRVVTTRMEIRSIEVENQRLEEELRKQQKV